MLLRSKGLPVEVATLQGLRGERKTREWGRCPFSDQTRGRIHTPTINGYFIHINALDALSTGSTTR